MGSDPVRWEVDGRGVVTVTLDRPEVGNAYDQGLIDGLHAALDALLPGSPLAPRPGSEPGPRVVVLCGAGRYFQAGADLGWVRAVAERSPAENVRVSRRTAEAVWRLDALPLPTVALVQGGCFGGGTGLLAACDVVVAADDAVFSIAETRWGLTPAIILPQLVDAIGPRQARRYALTGERFDAREARRIGLVHEVVPRAGLEAAAGRIVDALLRSAPGATAATKAQARACARDAAAPLLDRLVAEHAAQRQSAEAADGLAAFRDKRPPAWAPDPAG